MKEEGFVRVVELIEKIGLEKVKEKVNKGILFDREKFNK